MRTKLTGFDLLNSPRLNKGTAFTESERDVFSLHGLIPPHVATLDEQRKRRWEAFSLLPRPIEKYVFMRDLQDANETLFYSLINAHVEETLPIVYTPTVGEACEKFSDFWQKPRGLFLSYPNRERIQDILAHQRYDEIRCIVVSDGERILGLGDQGVGGMGIPIGKLSLYTALAGIRPEYCLPILLDVGTDNEERLRNPLYLGWRNRRVRGADYDDFVERFVSAVERRWPHALLQWEDFSGANAAGFLNRYRNRLCTFNDDIQGTAAVGAGTLLSAINVSGVPLSEQRIAILGLGAAGLGIAGLIVALLQGAGLTKEEAYARIYAIDRQGLLVRGDHGVRPDQEIYARARVEVSAWRVESPANIDLLEVIRQVKPTVLIGVSGHPGAFREEAIRTMGRQVERPIIFPLSNPTSCCEATPQQIADWTEGRGLIGTGSPFAAIEYNGRAVPFSQTNNSYIFPGMALGILCSAARRVSDGMIKAAALALADLAPTRRNREAPLLPPLSSIRSVSRVIAQAVGEQAVREGLADVTRSDLAQVIAAQVWEPEYEEYEL